MKFSIPLGLLSDALGSVGRAGAVKGVRPILANVLVNVENGEIRLVGTDMEIMALARIPATVETPGHFTIPAKLLQEIIGSLPGDANAEVRCELLDGQENLIQISSGRNKFSLPVQGVEDFPPIPSLESEEYPKFELAAEELRRALKEVGIAVGNDEGNPSQRSICWNFGTDRDITLAATDSRRLAVTRIHNVAFPEQFGKMLLLPARALAETIKLLEATEKVTIGLFQQQLVLTAPQFQLITRLIDGKFPDYNRVLPKESNRRLIADRKELVQSLKTVTPIARHSSQMVRLDIGQNETKIWAESREEGRSEAFLSTTLEGEPINIAFNALYMLDFLGVVDSDAVVLEMTTPSYPGVLRPKGDDQPFRYVVMPMTN